MHLYKPEWLPTPGACPEYLGLDSCHPLLRVDHAVLVVLGGGHRSPPSGATSNAAPGPNVRLCDGTRLYPHTAVRAASATVSSTAAMANLAIRHRGHTRSIRVPVPSPPPQHMLTSARS